MKRPLAPRARARLPGSAGRRSRSGRSGTARATTTSSCAAPTTARPRRASSSRWSSCSATRPAASTSTRTSSSTRSRRRRSPPAPPSTTCSPRCATRSACACASAGSAATSRCRTSTAPNRTTGRTASGLRTARGSGTTRRRSGCGSGAASTRCRRKGRTPDCRPGMPAPFCSLDVWFARRQLLAGPVAGGDRADQLRGGLPRRLSGEPLPAWSRASWATRYLPEQAACATRSRRASPTTCPGAETGFQLNYRFYFDFYPGRARDAVRSLAADRATRSRRAIYQQLTPTLELRVLLRYYRQNHARFWCDAPRMSGLPPTEFCLMAADPPSGYAGTRPTTPPIRSWAPSTPRTRR